MATQKIYNKKLNMEIQVHVSENCYRNYQRSLELAWVHQVGENLYSSHQKKKKKTYQFSSKLQNRQDISKILFLINSGSFSHNPPPSSSSQGTSRTGASGSINRIPVNVVVGSLPHQNVRHQRTCHLKIIMSLIMSVRFYKCRIIVYQTGFFL